MKPILAVRDEAVAGASERTTSIRWALASLSLSMLMPSLDTSIANTALPTLARAFAASFQAVQWIVLAYLLAITSLLVGVGRFGDLVGRRRLLLVGVAVFTASSLLCGVAPTLWFLIAARALQGLGAAVMIALALALVSETVPRSEAGAAMGLLGTMSAIGTTLGPSLGGLLGASVGWRAIFLVNVPLGMLSLLLAHRYLPADRPSGSAGRARFDHQGMAVLSLTLAAYALALTLGRGRPGAANGALLLVAAAGVALFLRTEANAASPLIRLGLLREPGLGANLAGSTLVSTVMMSTLVVGPFYLSRALGLDAARVGLVLSVGPLVAALSGVPAGRIVDRLGALRTTFVGLLGMAAGCLALSLVPSSFGVGGYLAPLVCITSSYALFQAANNTAVMTRPGTEQRGLLSGMLSLSRNLGLITGASLMGAVFSAASGAADLAAARPASIAAGMRATFAVAALLIVLALVLYRTSMRMRLR